MEDFEEGRRLLKQAAALVREVAERLTLPLQDSYQNKVPLNRAVIAADRAGRPL